MRAFIAIELPQEIRSTLTSLQNELKKSGADVKWVETGNIHLTLKFLGDRDDKKIEKIAEVLQETAQNNHPFPASIGTLGAFPSIKSPRVIWVGVNLGQDQICRIAEDLETKIAQLGIPKEDRAFSAHITIGRTRSALNLGILSQALDKEREFFGGKVLEFKISKLTLFKSTLTPKGSIYEVQDEANFKVS
jgi:2'-5' RNA ligase